MQRDERHREFRPLAFEPIPAPAFTPPGDGTRRGERRTAARLCLAARACRRSGPTRAGRA
ncbi:hypothetical protein [Brevundimonas sp.]|uniref:hypothetical protein n=1 Tax=Brevundimonas sp. TaxID=1871086 RepID=UPI00344CD9C8